MNTQDVICFQQHTNLLHSIVVPFRRRGRLFRSLVHLSCSSIDVCLFLWIVTQYNRYARCTWKKPMGYFYLYRSSSSSNTASATCMMYLYVYLYCMLYTYMRKPLRIHWWQCNKCSHTHEYSSSFMLFCCLVLVIIDIQIVVPSIKFMEYRYVRMARIGSPSLLIFITAQDWSNKKQIEKESWSYWNAYILPKHSERDMSLYVCPSDKKIPCSLLTDQVWVRELNDLHRAQRFVAICESSCLLPSTNWLDLGESYSYFFLNIRDNNVMETKLKRIHIQISSAHDSNNWHPICKTMALIIYQNYILHAQSKATKIHHYCQHKKNKERSQVNSWLKTKLQNERTNTHSAKSNSLSDGVHGVNTRPRLGRQSPAIYSNSEYKFKLCSEICVTGWVCVRVYMRYGMRHNFLQRVTIHILYRCCIAIVGHHHHQCV